MIKTLVVDDDESIREMLCGFLEDMGHSVFLAPNGRVASELIMENGEIELLITDFRMPEMNGIELLNWCRARKFHFPIILITSDLHLLEAKGLALSDCCSSVLPKPLNRADLGRAVKNAEERRHVRDCGLGVVG